MDLWHWTRASTRTALLPLHEKTPVLFLAAEFHVLSNETFTQGTFYAVSCEYIVMHTCIQARDFRCRNKLTASVSRVCYSR